MKTRKELLLSALLLACGKTGASSPTSTEPAVTSEPVGMHPTGGGCSQNHCVPAPSPAPAASQAAPGFPMCPQSMNVAWTSQPNPRPFSADLTRAKRAEGAEGVCCYEAQRLCGGGRPLPGPSGPRVASLVSLARSRW